MTEHRLLNGKVPANPFLTENKIVRGCRESRDLKDALEGEIEKELAIIQSSKLG